jgi:hypothetical protein
MWYCHAKYVKKPHISCSGHSSLWKIRRLGLVLVFQGSALGGNSYSHRRSILGSSSETSSTRPPQDPATSGGFSSAALGAWCMAGGGKSPNSQGSSIGRTGTSSPHHCRSLRVVLQLLLAEPPFRLRKPDPLLQVSASRSSRLRVPHLRHGYSRYSCPASPGHCSHCCQWVRGCRLRRFCGLC